MKEYGIVLLLFASISAKSQIITRFAGGGALLGDDGPATNAHIHDAAKGVFDKSGNYYVADVNGYRIRKINTAAIISTVAGTGMMGESGDGELATAAELDIPGSIAIDSAGNLYIPESGGNRVRKVDNATGIISTIVGNGTASSTGDGLAATAATINDPQDLCFDKYGNLYISEVSARVRKINTSGIISTFAGNGIAGYSGDGSFADTSRIGLVVGLCSDTAGDIYMADNSNSRVFRVSTSGIISTYAGTDTGYLFDADGIPATSANIDPYKIVMDDTGNLYIAEYHNFRVRKVARNGIIYTVAGNGMAGQMGDGGVATSAEFDYPNGVALDACENLYITESSNNGLVHKVTFNPICNFSALNANEIIASSEIALYPNPACDYLTILDKNVISQIIIANVLGQTVWNQQCSTPKAEIRISALPPGLYLIAILDEEGNKTIKKVIKQ